MSDTAKKYLYSDFTLQEIITAVKSFPSNKAAGPDGFNAEFYKKFVDILACLLFRMINESKCNGKLPKTLYEANISLILKKGKDETDPASFRPIALQNVDRKIIVKILATRLNKHLTSIIHPDQTGFIPSRLYFSNVRRLLNTILIIVIPKELPFCHSMHTKHSIRLSGLTCLSHCAGLDSVKL